MPFFIFAAKLCPPAVEGSMFAMFMGLSNFGSYAGRYVGSSLLLLLGGVKAPDFEGLRTYVILRSIMRLIPICLVPLLVPRGSPRDTARAMGAGPALVGDEQAAESDEDSGCSDPSSTSPHLALVNRSKT